MEVVSKQSISDPSWMQFGTVAESLPNWGLPFCMELRFVFETQHKLYYILDYGGESSLADLMNDGLPEPTVCIVRLLCTYFILYGNFDAKIIKIRDRSLFIPGVGTEEKRKTM
jgi:hypothetical protein